jgi:predicted GIY-YIG superfamily endonuclease
MNHNADLKPSLIDLEADNTATGSKQESTDSVQLERLSERDSVYILYWIRLDNHTDPYTEGYIGITKDFKERMRSHKKSRNKYVINNAIQKHGWDNLHKDILHENLSLKEILDLEKQYRSEERIGWNLQRGGEFGVGSDWYKDVDNRLHHANATSIGTKQAIRMKDTKEARSERAKLSWKKNAASYEGKSRGSKNGKARLNEDQVMNIKCKLIPEGLSNKDIAEQYDVKSYVIAFIRKGKTWKHVVCDSPDHK